MWIFKEQFTQKWTFCHYLLILILIQSYMRFFIYLIILFIVFERNQYFYSARTDETDSYFKYAVLLFIILEKMCFKALTFFKKLKGVIDYDWTFLTLSSV